jgi:hypothetical protein
MPSKKSKYRFYLLRITNKHGSSLGLSLGILSSQSRQTNRNAGWKDFDGKLYQDSEMKKSLWLGKGARGVRCPEPRRGEMFIDCGPKKRQGQPLVLECGSWLSWLPLSFSRVFGHASLLAPTFSGPRQFPGFSLRGRKVRCRDQTGVESSSQLLHSKTLCAQQAGFKPFPEPLRLVPATERR